MNERLRRVWWALRLTYGLVPILAGLDKFLNILTDWAHYLSPAAARLIPLSPGGFMRVVGVIEIVAGILVLSRATRLGAYVVALWLLAIALNLLVSGQHFDIAVRDVALAVGAFCLAKLTEARATTSIEKPLAP